MLMHLNGRNDCIGHRGTDVAMARHLVQLFPYILYPYQLFFSFIL